MTIKFIIPIVLFLLSLPTWAQLPEPGFRLDDRTALVITDPQIDFLSPDGVTWGVVGKSVTANRTVEHLEQLFVWADQQRVLTFVSPHYYYPHDHQWEFEGVLEAVMHNIGMFDRADPLSLENFEGSGADWMPQYKQYIESENTIVCSPHKVYGPQSNDLVLQLRKRGIDKVILAGMSGNLCVDSHLRDLLEQGFEVAVVSDATASAILPDAGLDGWQAALTNYKMLSSKVFLTQEVIRLNK
ncbi:MAG TPA: isochorismatase [Cytophagales bacterium]|nr:isochorismatase [Cytophagales bacterium]HAA17780.1 isochorismatase [Cytophagales bacterium]HAP59844.1 isochorismatase [Cytophagales bacterium]